VKIAVARETREGENRVAMVPELVGKLSDLGYEVLVEPDAGALAQYADELYVEAGAEVSESALTQADVVLGVNALSSDRARRLRDGAAVLSFLPVNSSHDLVVDLRDIGVTSFAMELVPRISRAQSMDALSSQALVSGYRCAIVAAGLLRRFFPLNMTAAGTVQPAQVVVLGAGVAGLQAIATSKRLGAVVQAYDVRAAAAEEIRSVGAKSIDLELETLEGAGGYAREMSEDRAQRQMEALAPYIANADALITTAAVPGRQAPMLVTAEMVEQMKPGSVVVDLAAESGGNVQGSVAGKVVRIGHAQVWGGDNVPSQMPGPASKLYAQNLVSLLTLMTHDGEFAPDFEDEVIAGAAVTHAGRIVHEPTREAIEGPVEPEPQPQPEPEPGGSETVADTASSTTTESAAADEQLDLPFDQEDEK
jgi:NAD(P) transhydrogenase subunit alpha